MGCCERRREGRGGEWGCSAGSRRQACPWCLHRSRALPPAASPEHRSATSVPPRQSCLRSTRRRPRRCAARRQRSARRRRRKPRATLPSCRRRVLAGCFFVGAAVPGCRLAACLVAVTLCLMPARRACLAGYRVALCTDPRRRSPPAPLPPHPPCSTQELASQGQVITSLRAELEAASEAARAAATAAAAADRPAPIPTHPIADAHLLPKPQLKVNGSGKPQQ